MGAGFARAGQRSEAHQESDPSRLSKWRWYQEKHLKPVKFSRSFPTPIPRVLETNGFYRETFTGFSETVSETILALNCHLIGSGKGLAGTFTIGAFGNENAIFGNGVGNEVFLSWKRA